MRLHRGLALPLAILLGCAEPRPAIPSFEHPTPTVSRRALLELLESQNWDGLEQLFADLERRAEAAPDAELDLALAYETFAVTTPTVGESLETFSKVRPESATANLLLAHFRGSSGWHARGSKWASETTDAQFREMERWHRLAEQSVARSLELDAERMEGDLIRLDLASSYGGVSECRMLADRLLERRPSSYRVRAELLACLVPRWGGSYKEMDKVARDAVPLFGQNPRLAALFGFADADRANRALDADQYELALEFADRALATGEAWRFYYERGRALRELDRPLLAMAAFDRALELQPESPGVLIRRADTYLGMSELEAMQRDYELAKAVAPFHSYFRWLDRRIETRAVGLRWAERHGFDRVFALGRDAWKAGRKEEAYNVLGWAAVLDPGHYEANRSLAVAAADRGNYEYSVRTWTRYLKVHPDDGRALVERASYLEELGETQAAASDLERACRLGLEQACGSARRR